MPDIEDALSGLKSYFSAGDINDPRVNPQLRQRIAQSLMSQKKGYPKTIGEGLTAIGDAIGDRGLASMLARSDIDQQTAAKTAADEALANADQRSEISPRDALAYAPGAVSSAALPPAATPTQGQGVPSVLANATAALPPTTPPVAPPVTPPTAVAPDTAAVPAVNPNAAPGLSQPPGGMPGARDRLAALLTARAVPQPNPTQPEAVAPPGGLPRPPGGPAVNATPTATDIQPAPLPPQVRAMPPPAVPVADYGYIRPPGQAAARFQPAPPSALEMKIQQAIANNPNNPYLAQRLTPYLAQEQAKRNLADKLSYEQYQSNVLAQREYEAKRQDEIATQAKRIGEGQEQQQKLNAPIDIEGKYVPVPGQPGAFREPTILGQNPNAPPAPKLTENQQKAVLYHGWASIAQDQLRGKEDILAKGFAQELAGKAPFGGNVVLNAQYRAAKNAAEAFTAAWLRSTSGANFGQAEQEQHLRMLIPKAGDDPQTLQNKAALREMFIRSNYLSLGRGGQQAADYNIRQYQQGLHDPATAPPVTITTKEQRDALSPGQHYNLPGDAPGSYRVKKASTP